MVAVGDASYSVYLLHYVVFVGSVYLCAYLAPPIGAASRGVLQHWPSAPLFPS